MQTFIFVFDLIKIKKRKGRVITLLDFLAQSLNLLSQEGSPRWSLDIAMNLVGVVWFQCLDTLPSLPLTFKFQAFSGRGAQRGVPRGLEG